MIIKNKNHQVNNQISDYSYLFCSIKKQFDQYFRRAVILVVVNNMSTCSINTTIKQCWVCLACTGHNQHWLNIHEVRRKDVSYITCISCTYVMFDYIDYINSGKEGEEFFYEWMQTGLPESTLIHYYKPKWRYFAWSFGVLCLPVNQSDHEVSMYIIN